MEISQDKNKTMVNLKNDDKNTKIGYELHMNGIILQDVKTFTYIGATLKSDGSSDNELRIRLEITTS